MAISERTVELRKLVAVPRALIIAVEIRALMTTTNERKDIGAAGVTIARQGIITVPHTTRAFDADLVRPRDLVRSRCASRSRRHDDSTDSMIEDNDNISSAPPNFMNLIPSAAVDSRSSSQVRSIDPVSSLRLRTRVETSWSLRGRARRSRERLRRTL